MRSVGFTRGLFAIAAASLAILSLSYGDQAPMGQALPTWIPWRETWLYGSALLALAASAGLCISRTALPSAWIIGAYLAVWAATCVPPILANPLSIGSWYGFCEAMTSLAGAWILYANLQWQSPDRTVRAAQILFGLTCVFYGASHFAYADYTAGMVPNWLPAHLGFAYFTGLGHIAAGIGIIVAIFPRLAATLEAIMMSLFGLLVWVPSFMTYPRPAWATPPQNQWSELVINLMLAAAAWVVASSFRARV